ncbi:MAG: TIGR04086 family membrane protein [Clostridia bacterium]|nr:TIGR04086 family membrane protein [Clostridia bacterium]
MSKLIQTRTSFEVNDSGIASGIIFMLKTVLFSYLVSVVLLFLASILATFQAFSDQAISIVANSVTALGVFLCGFMSGRHFSSRGLVFGAICGVIYAVLLLIIGNLASGTMSFGTDALTALAIGIICGAVGGIVGINTKRQRRRSL